MLPPSPPPPNQIVNGHFFMEAINCFHMLYIYSILHALIVSTVGAIGTMLSSYLSVSTRLFPKHHNEQCLYQRDGMGALEYCLCSLRQKGVIT